MEDQYVDPETVKISAEELRDFLSGKVKKLRFIRGFLIVVIIAVVIAFVAHVIYYYNYLTALVYDVINAKANVEAAVQYRTNLVPVLIESVARFVDHEDNVFFRATDARERSLGVPPEVAQELQEAVREQPVEKALQKIIAIAEQYPDLKTSEPFQLLMKQVTEAETKIMECRTEYNNRVNIYTTISAMFPGILYAKIFSFGSYEYFEGGAKSEWPEEAVLIKEEIVSKGGDRDKK